MALFPIRLSEERKLLYDIRQNYPTLKNIEVYNKITKYNVTYVYCKVYDKNENLITKEYVTLLSIPKNIILSKKQKFIIFKKIKNTWT